MLQNRLTGRRLDAMGYTTNAEFERMHHQIERNRVMSMDREAPMGNINDGMRMLQGEVERLKEQIELVHMRLQPVMRPEEPKAMDPSNLGPGDDHVPDSGMAMELKNQAASIHSSIDVLQEILYRLDL